MVIQKGFDYVYVSSANVLKDLLKSPHFGFTLTVLYCTLGSIVCTKGYLNTMTSNLSASH